MISFNRTTSRCKDLRIMKVLNVQMANSGAIYEWPSQSSEAPRHEYEIEMPLKNGSGVEIPRRPAPKDPNE